MPGFDRRGPMGQGPATGGGRGYCVSGQNIVDRDSQGVLYGLGRGGIPRGCGMGRGFGGGNINVFGRSRKWCRNDEKGYK